MSSLICVRTGNALRIARRPQPASRPIIIGVADPGRPHAAAERSGRVFDVLPRRRPRAICRPCCERQEQAALAAATPPLRTGEFPSYGVVGTSTAMRPVMELVQRSAQGQCGILICGERGSGREMIARAIHAHSAHRDSPFVTVDCSASEPEDVELQLFGVLVKARSNAPERRSLERVRGNSRLQESAGGYLLLENVAELSAKAQARWSRLATAKCSMRSGSGGLAVRVLASADASSIRRSKKDGFVRTSMSDCR